MHTYFLLALLKELPSYIVIKQHQVRKRTDVNKAYSEYINKEEMELSLKHTLVEGGYGEIVATPALNNRSWIVSVGSVVIGKLFSVERPMTTKVVIDDESYYYQQEFITGPDRQQYKLHPLEIIPLLEKNLIIECLN